MKILSIPQVREADAYTIDHEPIPSIDLMERAAGQVFDWISGTLPDELPYTVICGPGNNGGDGLALARMLLGAGRDVNTIVVWLSDKVSEDFRVNLERLEEMGAEALAVRAEIDIPPLPQEGILVDALFGSGLDRPVTGLAARVIERMNGSGAFILAIDSPSGLFADGPTDTKGGAVVKADYTLTFQFPKLSFLFAESAAYTGDWAVLPIGLHDDFIQELKAPHHLVTAADVRSILRERGRFDHKGHFGHALLIAGNPGKLGAAVLAAEACLRSGPGLLTLSLPPEGIPVLQTAVPEAMVVERPGDYQFIPVKELERYDSIAAGPGLGTGDTTASALKFLIQGSSIPLILDADALNILGENKTWLAFLPKGSILTPHPKEFERIAGKSSHSFERMQLQKEMSIKYGVYIILKGAHSCISTPEGHCWFNSTGNPGMATGGSGDSLTGILAGLMAQGYSPLETAILGTWVHGFAADLALEESAWEALLPSDINGMLGAAFRWLREELSAE